MEGKMTTDIEALRAWKSFPKERRDMLLSNVFCGHGCGVVTIVDYDINVSHDGILLKGKCDKCSGPVARYVEEVFKPPDPEHIPKEDSPSSFPIDELFEKIPKQFQKPSVKALIEKAVQEGRGHDYLQNSIEYTIRDCETQSWAKWKAHLKRSIDECTLFR